MANVRMIVVVALALLAGIAVAQNTEVVAFRFLLWEWSMSRILLLSGALLVGFTIGFSAAKLTGRRQRS